MYLLYLEFIELLGHMDLEFSSNVDKFQPFFLCIFFSVSPAPSCHFNYTGVILISHRLLGIWLLVFSPQPMPHFRQFLLLWFQVHLFLCSIVQYSAVLSPISRFMTPWTVALQAPLSMGFSRQGYLSGLPFPAPGGSS